MKDEGEEEVNDEEGEDRHTHNHLMMDEGEEEVKHEEGEDRHDSGSCSGMRLDRSHCKEKIGMMP